MADPLICTDCIHYIRKDLSILDRCGRVPMDQNAQYVRAEQPECSFCTTQRSRSGSCGPEGRLFEPTPLELKLNQDWRSAKEMEALMAEAGVDLSSAPVEGASDAPA